MFFKLDVGMKFRDDTIRRCVKKSLANPNKMLGNRPTLICNLKLVPVSVVNKTNKK